jgi:site-specific DNA recombinase
MQTSSQQITSHKEPDIAPPEAKTGRAFSYLRVSSDGQVKTDYSDDGLSMDVQRSGSVEKASQLAAEIVREFADPGYSAYVDLHKRVSFLEMLEELKRCNQKESTRVDYVIVWDLSRFCRNVADHFATHNIIRQAGARLVSITEPLVGEDSASAFLYEGMAATINQFQSMQTAEKVTSGLKKKASVGGTYSQAPLGYRHTVDDLGDGRRVRTVEIDPDRGLYMTVAFQLYASGEYSISQLVTELNRLGLRTRTLRGRQSKPITGSTLQRLLRNPYYAGQLVYHRGKPDEEVFQGRHEPLIDVETFERVQLLLSEKAVAGERPQFRHHYLRGSVFCGACGRRLTYSITTGRNGSKYPYFCCASRVSRATCEQRFNIQPEKIEAAIADYYRDFQLTPKQVERAQEAIRSLAAVSQGALNQIRTTKTQLIAKLEARQDQLLDMRFEKSISKTVFTRRQSQLEDELAAARESLAETDSNLDIDQAQLNRALALAADVHGVYIAADGQTRRGYNQAFFKKLLVIAEAEPGQRQPTVQVMGAELTPPYALLLAEDLVESVETEVELIRATQPQLMEAPRFRGKEKEASFASPGFELCAFGGASKTKTETVPASVSNFERLVPPVGLEPTTSTLKRRALYQLSYEGPTSLDSKAPPPWCSG